jgi:DNA repair protein RecO (recombination protein O)
MPAYNVNAIVLRRSELGETDKILRLFTREAGRIDAIAKGAKRGASKLSGATELFTYSRMQLATGKSLEIVTQCEIKESFPSVRSNIDSLTRATYLCELVDRLIAQHEPNPEVFDLLLSALYLLRRARTNPDVIVHSFEMHLLAERGYRPELSRCVRCGGSLDTRYLAFSPSLGGTLCGADSPSVDDAIPVAKETVELLFNLGVLETEDLLTLSPTPKASAEAARCLKWYIRYRVEHDLRSAEFLDLLRAEGLAARL